MSVTAFYRQRSSERQDALARRERQHAWMSYARLATAAAGGLILIVGGLTHLIWLLVPLAMFLALALVHMRVLNARDRALSAVGFYERGLARLEYRWIGHGRTGEGYRVPDHVYADDLDVFGRGSLFEMLATMRTHAGEATLARWLLTPATGDEARSRQAAVRELAPRLDLREAVAVVGDQVRIAVDAPILRAWAATPFRLDSRLRLPLAALAAATTTLLVVWMRTGAMGQVALVVLLLQIAVAIVLRPRVRSVIDAVEAPAHDLQVLASLLRILEGETFSSPRLQALARGLERSTRPSREIDRLSRHVAWLAARRNALFAIPSSIVLWGTQWAFGIEAWRRRAGTHVPEWLDAVGEFEVLLALGGYAAEHPDFAFPEIVDGAPELVATALAHPTLGSTVVANDVDLAAAHTQLAIVSGSNMSGKSTWMRAIGCAVVLAGVGAPVRARTCRLSPLAVGAAIRVQDSLTDGRSRFFAEISRLKQIVDLTRARTGVLFLLDEILSGTNSHDRRVGAEALLLGLVQHGAIGLVTTHDLALAAIVNRLPGHAINAHFADRFDGGSLAFDYLLRPGVVETSNALALMRSIGLEV